MDPVNRLARGATGALRLGRGLADRAIRVAGPRIARVIGRGTTHQSTPTTFIPSPREPAAAAPDPELGPVTPGSVARNIAKQRPVARSASGGPVRKSVPGAKLPPRRPSTTA